MRGSAAFGIRLGGRQQPHPGAPLFAAAPAAQLAAHRLRLTCRHDCVGALWHAHLQACGSGGTTAGLALGNHLAGYGAKVHAYGEAPLSHAAPARGQSFVAACGVRGRAA